MTTMPPTGMKSPEHGLGAELGETLEFLRAIWGLNHAIERASARMDVRLGVTAQQRLTIRVLGRGPMSPSKLAKVLCVEASTVSTTVRRLEAKGLVKRTASPSDGRQVVLTLTKKGRALDKPDEASLEGAVERVIARVGDLDTAITRAFLRVLTEEIEGDEPRPAALVLPGPQRIGGSPAGGPA